MRHNLRVFIQRRTTMIQKLIGKTEQALTENLQTRNSHKIENSTGRNGIAWCIRPGAVPGADWRSGPAGVLTAPPPPTTTPHDAKGRLWRADRGRARRPAFSLLDMSSIQCFVVNFEIRLLKLLIFLSVGFSSFKFLYCELIN